MYIMFHSESTGR